MEQREKYKQYLYRPGDYEVVSLEIHCVQGDRGEFVYAPATPESHRANQKKQRERYNRSVEYMKPFIGKSFDPALGADNQRVPGPQPPRRKPGPAKVQATSDSMARKRKRFQSFVARVKSKKRSRSKWNKLVAPPLAPGEQSSGAAGSAE